MILYYVVLIPIYRCTDMTSHIPQIPNQLYIQYMYKDVMCYICCRWMEIKKNPSEMEVE